MVLAGVAAILGFLDFRFCFLFFFRIFDGDKVVSFKSSTVSVFVI